MRVASPLRYPGGKWRIAPFINRLLDLNDLNGREYVEPYAGGASLALSLLLTGIVSRIHLNDLDPAIFAFWWAVLNKPDDMMKLIADTPLTVAEWQRQRSIYLKGRRSGRLALGFSTFYLNRTNHSGIMNGGLIGGKNQCGVWCMDARFNRGELRRRIQLISSKRQSIEIYQQDALQFMQSQPFPEDAFVYMDPPYYKAGKALYLNSYEPKDHSRVRAFAETLECPWLISYDDVAEIRALFHGYPSRQISLLHSARSVHIGREVMFFSPSLRIPRLGIPRADSKKVRLAQNVE